MTTGDKMKITKIQLRRIIQEEKAKLLSEDDDLPMGNYEDPDGGGMLPGKEELYFRALDELEEAMLNAAKVAIDKGLILDDIVDAWESVHGRIEHELEV